MIKCLLQVSSILPLLFFHNFISLYSQTISDVLNCIYGIIMYAFFVTYYSILYSWNWSVLCAATFNLFSLLCSGLLDKLPLYSLFLLQLFSKLWWGFFCLFILLVFAIIEDVAILVSCCTCTMSFFSVYAYGWNC